MCVCVCVCVCVCMCVSALHNNAKRNWPRDKKFEHLRVYQKNSDKIGIRHSQIKVKVTVGLKMFSSFTSQYNLTGPKSQLGS